MPHPTDDLLFYLMVASIIILAITNTLLATITTITTTITTPINIQQLALKLREFAGYGHRFQFVLPHTSTTFTFDLTHEVLDALSLVLAQS